MKRLSLALFGVCCCCRILTAQTVKPRRAANLFSGSLVSAPLTGNRVFCAVDNLGGLCGDVGTVFAGGFWPSGTADQYIFRSGLQVAGVIPAGAGGGKPAFGWAGDTIGAYFMDGRGDQQHAESLTPIFNSRDTADLRQWPAAAVVRDSAIFHPLLLGRDFISEQDLWTRYWDGNPRLLAGRTHPMGILVDQRALAFATTEDNQDIVYFVFTIYNVTARSASVYANPGIAPELRDDIAALGARFQDSSEARLGVSIPDGGYRMDSVYVALYMDADLGDAGSNYSNVVLPFNLGLAYKSDFLEPTWAFPADLFGQPLTKAPGFVGVKPLRSAGLAQFSNVTGSPVGHADPVGVGQLWRWLSGNISAAYGDSPCQVPATQLHYCYLTQSPADTRFYISTGPFSLDPGQATTVVIAYLFAAPTPAVTPYIGGDLKPGIPAPGDSIAADTARIRVLERAAGWVTQGDSNSDGAIEADEVTTVPRSLLDKARVAQAVADHKFLLPSAPEPPSFYLLPGDNQVTVVWQKSATEVAGDPYFALADDPASALYDPNYRRFDVEGYRIYRGRDPRALELVAQFDYAGTSIVDHSGAFVYPGECAPELGVTADCPDLSGGDTLDLGGDLVQAPLGGRILLDGKVFLQRVDTAVTGGNSGFPRLTNTGVDFAFVDQGARNSFGYYYAVTAFDVNSIRSGRSSLESPRYVKTVTPRRPAPNTRSALLVQGVYGGDGTPLDPAQPYPAIDTATGALAGVLPATNGLALDLLSPVLEALPAGEVAARIDSISAGFGAGIGTPPSAYVTFSAPGYTLRSVFTLNEPVFNATSLGTFLTEFPLVPFDSAAARRFAFSLDTGSRMPARFTLLVNPTARTSSGSAVASGRFGLFNLATQYLAHSRWFDEGGAEPPDPTIVGLPDPAHNSGKLTGVGRIWAPQAYRDRGTGQPATPISTSFRGYSYAQVAWYPADFVVTWNADSSVTVRDSTHRTTLPWGPNGGTGYGFVNVRAYLTAGLSGADLGDTTGTPAVGAVGYHHLYALKPLCGPEWKNITCVALERTAQYEPLDFDHDGTADASGIAIVINGEAFLMEMSQVPAAGTKWHLRAVAGTFTATCTPALAVVMSDCSAYTFTGPGYRPAYAPGVTYKITVQRAYTVDTLRGGDLSRVHTVPDPYYVADALETGPTDKVLRFVNVPSRAIIRVYSASGVLVRALAYDDPSGGGEVTWDLRSRTGRFVASGVYFYHIETADHRRKIGRFTIVTYRP
jgi:hypothetical protein